MIHLFHICFQPFQANPQVNKRPAEERQFHKTE